MDNQSNGTHEEQISLYGLFGDSLTTLQGLNDHLSPSSLQQSPPCGSTKSVSASISVSPLKFANSSINQHGLMLSDLADRSPRSDRVGASVLCSFVSIENLRCTRVSVKGQKFCDLHQNQELPKPLSSLSKPSVQRNVASPTSQTKHTLSKIVSMSSPLISPSRTYAFVPNLASDVEKFTKIVSTDVDSVSQGTSLHLPGRMVNVSTSASSANINGVGSPTRIPNSLLGQKVGQQITVATKVQTSGLTKKVGDVSQNYIKAVSTTSWNTGLTNNCSKSNSNIVSNALDDTRNSSFNRMNMNLNYPLSSSQHKTVRFHVAKPVMASNGVTNGICQSTVSDFSYMRTKKPQQFQQLPQKQSDSSKTKYLLCTAVTSQPASHTKSQQTLQSFVVDEKTMKKLVEVLNSQNDATSQQQISLMNSLGITVVRPSENDGSLSKKRSLSMKKAGTTSKTRPKVAKKFTVKQSDVDRGHAGASHVFPNWMTSSNENSRLTTTLANQVTQKHDQLSSESSPLIKSDGRTADLRMLNVTQLNANDTSVHLASSHTCVVKPMNLNKQTTAVVSALKRKVVQISSDTTTKPGNSRVNDSVVCSNGAEIFSDSETMKCKISYKQNENSVNKGGCVSANNDVKKFARPAFLTVRKGASTALEKYAELFNKERIKECGLFDVGHCLSASDTDPGIDVSHSLNAGKRKVFTKKLTKSRRKEKKDSNLHETCLKALDKTDFHEKLKAARTLITALVVTKRKTHGSKHDEDIKQRILERPHISVCKPSDFVSNLTENDFWLLEETNYLHEACSASCAKQRKIEYSLKNRRLKRELKKQRKLLQRNLHSANLLMQAWEENSAVTDRALSSLTPQTLVKKSSSLIRKRCQLSDSNGLNCSATALPYALYCKQHIWHCRSQCLYKLDKNMKPVADVNVEPFVKRTRKRTKLLPLIKRYKKKRKKKPLDVPDSSFPSDKIEGSVARAETILSKSGLRAAGSQFEPISVSQNILKVEEREETADENRTADTSEEDLNLTGQEIMINAVFDKLPEDIHDFDLFTTDKGAEELEQALLLDANTPQLDSEPLKVSSHCDISKQQVDRAAKHSSDHCVVLDVPASNGSDPPLSVISVNGSQCVHYTFGSNCGMVSTYLSTKKDVPNNCVLATSSKDEPYNSMELTEPVLSAEDLQDIEGVLESLQKDVDATKSPSSPAVDHYTNMLARQLSREVEGESFQKQLSSTSRSIISPMAPKTVSTTGSLCLPISSDGISTPSTNHDLADSNLCENSAMNHTAVEELRVAPKSLSSYSLASTMLNSSVVSCSSKLAKTNSTATLTTNIKNGITQQTTNSVVSQSPAEKSQLDGTKVRKQNKSTAPQISFYKKGEHPSLIDLTTGKESVGLQTQLEPGADTKKASKKSPWKVNQIVSNGLPTQSPAQGGNILRVIVPHGTVVSGANTNAGSPQNMILIPVSTLVRPNLMLAPKQNADLGTSVAAASHQYSMVVNQAVKTQLTNLQAGQQFFIVNGGAGLHQKSSSSQHRFTVMQKNKSINACQRTLILNPVTSPVTSAKNGTSIEQKQPLNQKNWKPPLCNIKPNVSIYLNGSVNNYIGGTVATASKLTKPGKVQAMPKLTNPPIALANATLNARLKSSVYRQKPTAVGKSQSSQVNLNGGMKTKTKKPIKARFDPITKKYVPANVSLMQETVVPNSPPISNLKLSKTILKEKFTQSTLSIQNKVEQINSVLSSLNSAKVSSGGGPEKHLVHNMTTNGLIDRVSVEKYKQIAKHCAPILSKSKNSMVADSGVTLTSSRSLTTSASKVSFKSVGPQVNNTSLLLSGDEQTLPVILKHTQQYVASTTEQASRGSTSPTVNGSVVVMKSQENRTSTTELSPIVVSTAVVSDTNDPCKQSESFTTACTGTVHWNQTTTAGPEINPHLTLPVFVNGTLPTGAWLSKVGTDGRQTKPALFATRKVCPSYQLSQRVILGNIGSLGGVLSANINSSNKSSEATSSTRQTFTQSTVKVTNDQASDMTIQTDATSSSNAVIIQAIASSATNLNSLSCGALKLLVSPSSSVTNVTAVMGTTMSPKLSTLNTTKIGNIDICETANSESTDKHVALSFKRKVSDASSSKHDLKYYTGNLSTNSQWSTDILTNTTKKTLTVSSCSSTSSERIFITQDEANIVSNHTGAEDLVDVLNVPSKGLIKTEEKTFPRKNVRKNSHNTLLFDPFMYDPTSVKSVSSSAL